MLQDLQQLLARDAGKAVAGRDDFLAAIMHRDIVPIGKMAANFAGAQRIVLGEVFERLVGQDHAPVERVVRLVALEHGDVMRAVAQLHADRKIKARRAAAEASDLHGCRRPAESASMMAPWAICFKLKDLSLKLRELDAFPV